MKKAFLIIDMPDSCMDCSIMFQDEQSYWCPCKQPKHDEDVFDYIKNNTKPDWCPLKELSALVDDDGFPIT